METQTGHEPWREHVRLLAIFHWIVAGFAALCSMFPVLHLVMGIAVVTEKLPGGGPGDSGRLVGWLVIAFAGTLIALGLAFASCLAIAGRNLLRLRRHTFCFVMGAIGCFFMPFGTVLGVFTIIVLSKPEVRAAFDRPPTRPADA